MRAEYQGMYSPDLGEDPDKPGWVLPVERYAPEDPSAFRLLIAVQIGVVGSSQFYDLFYFDVCTPTWLAEHPAEKGFRWGHGLLLLDRWDYDVLERAIRDRCLHTEASDLLGVLAKLELYGVRG